MIRAMFFALAIALGLVSIPVLPESANVTSESETESIEWAEFHVDAFCEYSDEFTALFNSYETKWAKNGRLMMKTPDGKSFKFVAKGK